MLDLLCYHLKTRQSCFLFILEHVRFAFFYHLKRVRCAILLSRGMLFCLLYLDTVKDCQKPNKSRIHYNVLGMKLSRHFRLFICFSETKRQQWWKR